MRREGNTPTLTRPAPRWRELTWITAFAVAGVWGAAVIALDLAAYNGGQDATAVVVEAEQLDKYGGVWRATFRYDGNIHATDHFLRRERVSPGDPLTVRYLALGRWHHAIVPERRNWIRRWLLPVAAAFFGVPCLLALCIPRVRRDLGRPVNTVGP